MHSYATRSRGYGPVLESYRQAYDAVEKDKSYYSDGLKWHLYEAKSDINSMTRVSAKAIFIVAAIALIGAAIIYKQADFNQNMYDIANAASQVKNYKAHTPNGEDTGATFGQLIKTIVEKSKESSV